MVTGTNEMSSLFTQEFKRGYYAGASDSVYYSRAGFDLESLICWARELQKWRATLEEFSPLPVPKFLEMKEDGSSS